jgi:hypothetical protein
MDGQFDRPIGQRLFGHDMSLATGFDLRFFDRVRLAKGIEVFRVAPEAANIRRAE